MPVESHKLKSFQSIQSGIMLLFWNSRKLSEGKVGKFSVAMEQLQQRRGVKRCGPERACDNGSLQLQHCPISASKQEKGRGEGDEERRCYLEQADSFQSKASKAHPRHHKRWKRLWMLSRSSEWQQDKVCMGHGKRKQGDAGNDLLGNTWVS